MQQLRAFFLPLFALVSSNPFVDCLNERARAEIENFWRAREKIHVAVVIRPPTRLKSDRDGPQGLQQSGANLAACAMYPPPLCAIEGAGGRARCCFGSGKTPPKVSPISGPAVVAAAAATVAAAASSLVASPSAVASPRTVETASAAGPFRLGGLAAVALDA